MIKVKVPQLLEKHGMNATDLMRQAGISYTTAHKLSKGTEGKGMSFQLLDSLCKLFDVTVGEILEFTPDK